MEDIVSIFEKYNDQYLKFKNVKEKFSSRADLHAFILLDRLVTGISNIVSGAEHDEILLDVSISDLENSSITEQQVCDLVRCGVRVDSDYDCLCMFS